MLVIGGSGFLGTELLRQAAGRGDEALGTYARSASTDALASEHLDVTDRPAVAALVANLRPDAIINTASVQGNWRVTADGAAHVAIAAATVGARLVHMSSDAVFSGSASSYSERASPDPVTAYGAAKGAAETAVGTIAPSAAIVRTSLIVGDGGASKHEQRAWTAARGGPGLFVDDIRCPVHIVDLASALLVVADRTDAAGVFHLAGPEAVSRYELGRLIARRDGLDPDSIRKMREADEPNRGPLDVRLDSRDSFSALGVALRGASRFLQPQNLPSQV